MGSMFSLWKRKLRGWPSSKIMRNTGTLFNFSCGYLRCTKISDSLLTIPCNINKLVLYGKRNLSALIQLNFGIILCCCMCLQFILLLLDWCFQSCHWNILWALPHRQAECWYDNKVYRKQSGKKQTWSYACLLRHTPQWVESYLVSGMCEHDCSLTSLPLSYLLSFKIPCD